jgi:hypothetical protein
VVETWAFSETIHSRSYTHIIRGMVDDPSEIFDGIVTDEQIISRASSVSAEYDKLYQMVCAREHLGKMNLSVCTRLSSAEAIPDATPAVPHPRFCKRAGSDSFLCQFCLHVRVWRAKAAGRQREDYATDCA